MTTSIKYRDLSPALREPFSPAQLLAAAEQDPGLAPLLAASAEVWEGYTVAEHTRMVLAQFERFWADRFSPAERKFWRLFLLLHDIGKAISVDRYGHKHYQHQTTWPVMAAVLQAAGSAVAEQQLARVLLQQDVLGQYLKDRLSLDAAAKQVIQMATELNWPAPRLGHWLYVFFTVDAGAYTVWAGGQQSLDDLFTVATTPARIELTDDHDQVRHRQEYQQQTPAAKWRQLYRAITRPTADS